MTNLNPYITFEGQAAEAMQFYQSVLGGELTSSTFSEFGMTPDPAYADKIMHSQLETEDGLVLMGADLPPGMPYKPGMTISISLSGDDEATLRSWFDGLSAGGTIAQAFEPAPWGDTFGMFTDKFGIDWLVNAAGQQD
ncbi:MAG: Glyoxalase/bleomycin resistance protein/dioxygenase [Aeromicrobium sp.]|jgi:PhnB protein|nr:Glyoxalase/bleomycin resistance protein/dioxygenase [Aeromicrobium sp.]